MLCPECQREIPPDSQFCNRCGASLGSPETAAPMSSPLGKGGLREVSSPIAKREDKEVSADFVGREREMSALTSALDDAFDRKDRLLLL
ncbi:MAG: zinc-ribbon domain-containing protein, partial [Chloroflexi bacterium]|nr:zinc-ribbon domain-containing protein [Chloroflexota bacterium]